MNKNSKFFVFGLLAVSLLGVGAASAFVTQGASSNTSGTVDNVVYLEWGETQSVDPITDLAYGTPVYRTISIKAPTASVSSGYTAQFSCSMTVDQDKSLLGVTAKIATQPWTTSGTTAVATVDTSTPYTVTVTTAQTYYVKYEVTEEAYAQYVAKTITMGGNTVFSYGFAA